MAPKSALKIAHVPLPKPARRGRAGLGGGICVVFEPAFW